MPATSSTKPSAPASTTLARRSISSFSGVASSETRAAASASRNSGRNSATPSRAAAARGPREVGDHREDRALARLGERFARVGRAAGHGVRELGRRESGRCVAARSPTPSRNCARIAPELPRAPSSAASATRVRSWPACGSGPARSATSTACSVSARFVPVSPSGTGNTLILLITSSREMRRWMPVRSAAASSAPSSASAGADGGVHGRAAARAAAGRSAGRGRRGRRPRG